jgi:hypothetical protein
MDKCREQYAELIASKRLALEHSNFVHASSIDTKSAFKKKIGIVLKKNDVKKQNPADKKNREFRRFFSHFSSSQKH